MAEDIVNARITFDTSGIGGNGQPSQLLGKFDELNKNFKQLLSGSLTGLIGGGGGGSGLGGSISGAVVGAIAAIGGIGVFTKSVVDEFTGQNFGPAGADGTGATVIELDVDNQNLGETQDIVEGMVSNFEQTPEIIKDLNVETGETNSLLRTQEDVVSDIIDFSKQNLTLKELGLTVELSITEEQDKQLRLLEQQNVARQSAAAGLGYTPDLAAFRSGAGPRIVQETPDVGDEPPTSATTPINSPINVLERLGL